MWSASSGDHVTRVYPPLWFNGLAGVRVGGPGGVSVSEGVREGVRDCAGVGVNVSRGVRVAVGEGIAEGVWEGASDGDDVPVTVGVDWLNAIRRGVMAISRTSPRIKPKIKTRLASIHCARWVSLRLSDIEFGRRSLFRKAPIWQRLNRPL